MVIAPKSLWMLPFILYNITRKSQGKSMSLSLLMYINKLGAMTMYSVV